MYFSVAIIGANISWTEAKFSYKSNNLIVKKQAEFKHCVLNMSSTPFTEVTSLSLNFETSLTLDTFWVVTNNFPPLLGGGGYLRAGIVSELTWKMPVKKLISSGVNLFESWLASVSRVAKSIPEAKVGRSVGRAFDRICRQSISVGVAIVCL